MYALREFNLTSIGNSLYFYRFTCRSIWWGESAYGILLLAKGSILTFFFFSCLLEVITFIFPELKITTNKPLIPLGR